MSSNLELQELGLAGLEMVFAICGLLVLGVVWRVVQRVVVPPGWPGLPAAHPRLSPAGSTTNIAPPPPPAAQ